MKGRGRWRFPTREELELRSRVTRHDEPLARRAPAAAPDGIAASEKPGPAPFALRELLQLQSTQGPGPARNNPASPPPPPAPFDPRASKRIARGRREIDARLDLHGLRQQDAYIALRRFLACCQAKGCRHVLIITGKGGSADREEERDFWTSEERGVLRRLVPHWLCEPSMRLHVVSFTESSLKHGGSGALYVTVRKGPRSRA